MSIITGLTDEDIRTDWAGTAVLAGGDDDATDPGDAVDADDDATDADDDAADADDDATDA
jgi:hypothetical protein